MNRTKKSSNILISLILILSIAFFLVACEIKTAGKATGIPSPSLTKTASPTVSRSPYYVCNAGERICEKVSYPGSANFQYNIKECRNNQWVNAGSCAINQECSNGECVEVRGLGAAILSPTQVIAGSKQTFTVIYTTQTPIN